jgi:hypothetical protein
MQFGTIQRKGSTTIRCCEYRNYFFKEWLLFTVQLLALSLVQATSNHKYAFPALLYFIITSPTMRIVMTTIFEGCSGYGDDWLTSDIPRPYKRCSLHTESLDIRESTMFSRRSNHLLYDIKLLSQQTVYRFC